MASFLAWTTDKSNPLMLGTSGGEEIRLRLPEGDKQTFVLNITVHIQDMLGCVTEVDLEPVRVKRDMVAFNRFLNDSASELGSSDLNAQGRRFTAYSVLMADRTDEMLRNQSLASRLLSSLSVPDLDSAAQPAVDSIVNDSSMIDEYRNQLNDYAVVREKLILNLKNLSSPDIDDIKFQSSVLAQLTHAVNQLTRKATVRRVSPFSEANEVNVLGPRCVSLSRTRSGTGGEDLRKYFRRRETGRDASQSMREQCHHGTSERTRENKD